MLSGRDLDRDRIAAEVARLREAIGAGLDEADAEATYELRYRGQAFELAVAASTEPDMTELVAAFEAEHERRYGHRNPDAEVELVHIRLALTLPAPEVEPRAATGAPVHRSTRPARFGGEWVDAAIVRGEPEAGTEIAGPGILELGEATLVLPPGWRAVVDVHGTVIASRR
jgi:N-methylhydantoinase A